MCNNFSVVRKQPLSGMHTVSLCLKHKDNILSPYAIDWLSSESQGVYYCQYQGRVHHAYLQYLLGAEKEAIDEYLMAE